MPTVLAFDIGIKNLAWCCLRFQEGKYEFLGWDNYNLLSDSSNVDSLSKKTPCVHCKAKGVYQHKEQLYCVRHSPLPALRDLSGNLVKKLPVMEICKSILAAKTDVKPKKKEDILEALKEYYALPLVLPKVTKAMDTNLSDIHDSLRKLVLRHKDMWSGCSLICLENQPAFKNPTMKSVQILLFATLRDILQPNPTPFASVLPPPSASVLPPPFASVLPPPLKLVHAGKKVEGAAKGDEGYKDRKAGSEARALAFLYVNTLTAPEAWRAVWEKATKKSDLADALCMCIDSLSA